MAALVLVCALSANGAELTRVASSFEENHPFGMFLDFTFDRSVDKGKIVREWYQARTNQDVGELRYLKTEAKLGIDVHIGLFRDLELHVGVPIIFQQDRAWGFAQGTTDANSTIYRNCVNARGGVCATPGLGTDRLFDVGNAAAQDGFSRSYRGGLGDLTFGIAWAPFAEKRDDTKPTWVLKFEYTAPTAALLDPSVPTTSSARGGLGDKTHHFAFSTAVSKRLGPIEPYFELHYTLPWAGPGYYSNCLHPSDANMARADNCFQGPWSKAETGIHAPHTGGFNFGTELTLFERAERHQRLTVDLSGWGTYVSEGRYSNELSDLMGKLLETSDYGQLGAQFGFMGQAADFVMLRAAVSWAYDTEHFLTNENIGRDLNNNGVVDVSSNPIEMNPNYDFRVDHQGRRFRITEQYVFRIQVTATFNF